MSLVVVGFKRRWGILMKCILPSGVVTVSVAISLGVRTAEPTSGFAEFVSSEKSPARRLGCGILLEFWVEGWTVQLCSYDVKNQVFLSPGIGPPTEPPASVILKNGLGYFDWKAVGAKAAALALSESFHAARAEFLLL